MNKQVNKPILPVCFCIHRNIVMGARIEVNGQEVRRLELIAEGIRQFVNTGLAAAAYELDAAILVFSDSTVWIRKFGEVGAIPDLQGDGTECCMGEALGVALNAIEDRVAKCTSEGRKCLRPILVVVSAGAENYGLPAVLEDNSKRCGALIAQGKLTARMYSMSKRADQGLLRTAAPGGTVEHARADEIIGKLSGLGRYVQADENNGKGSGAGSNVKKEENNGKGSGAGSYTWPNPGRTTQGPGDASSYILGIYTDPFPERG